MNLRLGLLVVLCLFSGFIGAMAMKLLDSPSQTGIVRTERLELVDSHNVARAVLSTGPDDRVWLRFLSVKGKPLVELGTTNMGEGRLTFSSNQVADQVTVGYSQYGDYDDRANRGAWGIRIAGPNHTETGLNVFTLNGALEGTQIPLEPPAHR
jgi:hypothetical protein